LLKSSGHLQNNKEVVELTLEELRLRLKEEGYPEDSYSLDGGLYNERLCLERRNNRWFIYYSEKGIRTNEKDFLMEEVACQYFYGEISRMVKRTE
jgi:hypothetical protein